MSAKLAAASVTVLAIAVVLGGQDRTDPPPTWAKDIAPLFHERCLPCHSDDGHGPFRLTEYQDVKRRWELVRQQLLNRQMPPSPYVSQFGAIASAPPFTDEQLVLFQRWIQAGMPEGQGAPQTPLIARSFRIGTPDLVLAPKTLPVVPLEGNPVWRTVILDPKHTQPLRIQAFDVVPKSRQAVRHVLIAVASDAAKEGETFGTLDGMAKRMVGTWAPGYPEWRLPEGVSFVVEPGERLVVQVLYQTTGRRLDTSFEIGFKLSESEQDRPATWITREVDRFVIPTFDETTLSTTAELAEPMELLAVVPEARFFAYVVQIQLLHPGQEKPTTVVETVQWSPYWSGSLAFRKPVALPAGSRLVANTVYENEPHTPINEGNRPRLVYSGTAIDQEVCRTHFLVVKPAAR